LALSPYLFAKVPRPGDSEVTFAVFESSCPMLLLSVESLKGRGIQFCLASGGRVAEI